MVLQRKENILKTKSEKFGIRIAKMYLYLTSVKNETVMSKQVYRSGTSIGANIAESINAESNYDFVHKLSIALKEANETEYWLTNLQESCFISDKEYNSMNHDNEELTRILVRSIKTKKERMGIDDTKR
jgi:four helix bundle protein